MKTKMKTRSPAILLLAVLTLLLPACAARQAVGVGAVVGVTYVWPRGAQAEYVLSNFQTQKVEIPGGGEQVLSNNSTIDMNVAATGDQDYTVTFTGGTQHDDAADLGQPIPDISRLAGLVSQVRLDERGEVVEATGLEGNSYVIDSGGVGAFRELNIQVVFPYLPEGRLSAGAQWSREYGFTIVQMDGTTLFFNVKDDYTCVEETLFNGTPAWKITQTSSQNVTGSGDIGVPMELAMSGNGQADIHVARDTAMMLGNESQATLNGTILVQDLSIPVSVSQATNVKKK